MGPGGCGYELWATHLEYLTLLKAECISQLFYYHGDISQRQINLLDKS